MRAPAVRRPGHACGRSAPTRHPVAGTVCTTTPAVVAAKAGRTDGPSVVSPQSSVVSQGAQEQARHTVTAAVERLVQDRTETWVTDGTDMDADTQVHLGQCSHTSGPPPRHSTSPDRATSISSQSCKPASWRYAAMSRRP